MSRTYAVGFDHGVRAAIHWLARRAEAMNDPQARHILNSAATNLGWDNADNRKGRKILLAMEEEPDNAR